MGFVYGKKFAILAYITIAVIWISFLIWLVLYAEEVRDNPLVHIAKKMNSTCFCTTPEGAKITAYPDGQVTFYNMKSGEIITTRNYSEVMEALEKAKVTDRLTGEVAERKNGTGGGL